MSLIGPSDEPSELEPPYIVTDLWVLAHRTPRLIKLKHVHDVISSKAHAVMQDLILAHPWDARLAVCPSVTQSIGSTSPKTKKIY
jgi:hypothetical protein